MCLHRMHVGVSVMKGYNIHNKVHAPIDCRVNGWLFNEFRLGMFNF